MISPSIQEEALRLWNTGDYNLTELCALTGVSSDTMRKLVRRGEVKVRKGRCRDKRTNIVNTNSQERACLKCSQLFRSVGVGNRLCDRCKRENRGVYTVSECHMNQPGKPVVFTEK